MNSILLFQFNKLIKTNSVDTLLEETTLKSKNFVIQKSNVKSATEISKSIVTNTIFNITKTNRSFKGENIFVLEQGNNSNIDQRWYSLLIVDMDGNILFEKSLANSTSLGLSSLSVEFINSTTILLGEKDSVVLWNLEKDKKVPLGFKGHHDYEYNPITNTCLTFNRYPVEIDGVSYIFDRIEEYNLDGEMIWYMNTSDFISYTQWCPYRDTSYGFADLTHSNTLFWDTEEDIIYYNSRNVNTFYKINHSSGDVIWGLGEYGNFTLYDKRGNEKKALFYHAHALEKIDENKFIIFDNDMHNQTNSENKISRIVELNIDEKSMIANESWTWEAPPDYFSGWWGDADRLPNGDRIGVFGTRNHPYTDIGARLVEVNEDGEIVWEMNFPKSNNYSYGIYRMERFRFNPILQPIEDRVVISNEDVRMTWQTWYNFRTKSRMNGSYQIYLNNSLIDSGIHTFDKFWKSCNLTINLGQLLKNTYNVTLVLTDEAGHSTTDTVFVTVSDFYIKRNGPNIIESGVNDSIITWSGFTVSPVNYSLIINGTDYKRAIWNGEIIEYDLNSLSSGEYYIELLFYNNSILINNESFLVTILPLSLPSFTSYPINQEIIWNQNLVLTWGIFDYSPNSYEIYLNGTKQLKHIWNNQSEFVIWSLPSLDEGIYNITILLTDQIGLKNSATTLIIVKSPSPPIISSTPTNTEIIWNVTTELIWEVHGGQIWQIWKNSTLAYTGELKSKYITLTLTNWLEGEWLPGKYNLTLTVIDEFNERTSSSIWLDISFQFGDAYANELIKVASLYYTNGKNALGAPDGNYAQIFFDYSNGYITLDMGLNEEILNGEGNDFTIFATGNYFVWVSNDLSAPFTLVGSGLDTQSFDLQPISYSIARYVKIEFRTGDSVHLDGVEAIYYNQITVDNDPPSVIGMENLWVWENVSSVSLFWELEDLTPWNYSISVNGTVVESGKWNGSDIYFEYLITGRGNTSVTLEVFDLFSNFAEDTVHIEIRPLPKLETEKTPFFVVTSIFAISLLYLRKRRKHPRYLKNL
ncbi:MAG: aryl-sulfate sulfotransferase [Candidatus Heimdallarchaeaceae archaeon]